MNIETIYQKSELDGLASNQLQQKAQEIKQRFDQRRNFYNAIRNNQFDFEKWLALHKKITEFNKTPYPNWQNKWNIVYRSANPGNLITFFDEGIKIFNDFEEDADLELLEQTYTHSDGIEDLKQELIEKIDSDMITIKNSFIESVDEGIKNVISLKS